MKSDDLIRKQDAIDWLENDWNGMVTTVFDGIRGLPSAQPVIRCKDCVYMDMWMMFGSCTRYCFCKITECDTEFDGYCHMAKRRTDE